MPKWYEGEKGWGNLALPDVYAIGAVQLYPRGTAYREAGRTFYYGKYSGTSTIKSAGYAVSTMATFKDLGNSVISGTVGGNTIVINYGGSCAKNKYAGGYLGVKGNNYRSWYIISNTVQDGSNYVTFTIDGTIPSAVATTDDVILMENPDAEWRWYITSDNRPYVGVTTCSIVVSEYTWLQTWGVHMQCAVFDSFEGQDSNQFGVFIYHGSFQSVPTTTSGVVANSIVVGAVQQAGVFACGSDPSSPSDLTIAYPVYLQLRP